MELKQQVIFWAKSISNPCSRHANSPVLNHELDKIESGLVELQKCSDHPELVQQYLDALLFSMRDYRNMSEKQRNVSMEGFGASVESYCNQL